MALPKRPKSCPVPIRFDHGTRYRISLAAERLGSSASAVVRFAVLRGLEEIESGSIRVPQPRKS